VAHLSWIGRGLLSLLGGADVGWATLADRQLDGGQRLMARVRDTADPIEALTGLARRRGFLYPSAEIYGESRAGWDYGPLGVELRENIRRQWWRTMVQRREDVVGLDSNVALPRAVWAATGHLDAYTDPLVQCRACDRRFRSEQLAEQFERRHGRAPFGLEEVPCSLCGAKDSFTEPSVHDGLVNTRLGVLGADQYFLRPEMLQGGFLNFRNVLNSARRKPPFGIAQTGRSFRNEIDSGPFIFRTREFEQMELAFFVEPGTDQSWHDYWLQSRWEWYVDLGLNPQNLRYDEHTHKRLAPYAHRTVDIEYRFGMPEAEFAELEGVTNRGDGDLVAHSSATGADLTYFDQEQRRRWVPFVIEPTAGLSRAVMAFLLDAYTLDSARDARGRVNTRTVLRLDPRLSPVKVAVLPLSRNPELSPRARELADSLREWWHVEFDDAGAIGRRYRRQDEIGTPLCVTVDFDTADDDAVTVRDRDSMEQTRVSVEELSAHLAERLPWC